MSASDKPADNELIAVVSCWEQFLTLARVYLLAAKVDPEALIVRSTRGRDWFAGLDAAALIICDSSTARRLPDDHRLRVFRLISDESITELSLALL